MFSEKYFMIIANKAISNKRSKESDGSSNKFVEEHERCIYRTQKGQLRISNDAGSDDPANHLEEEYSYLAPGEREIISGDSIRNHLFSKKRRK